MVLYPWRVIWYTVCLVVLLVSLIVATARYQDHQAKLRDCVRTTQMLWNVEHQGESMPSYPVLEKQCARRL